MSVAEASPKVSVLMPTYNYARYLPLAIESVLAQGYDDFEVIVSDDASTDDSVQVARHYAEKDPRVRVYRHETNLGMVANWNWCLRQARGRYVKFLFGDDALAMPDALRSLVELLDRHPSVVLAGSSRLLLDENSHSTGLWDDLWPGVHSGRALAVRCLRRRRNLIGEPSSVMFRRAAARRGFDPAYRQIVDMEMWFHLLMQGDLAYTPRPLCAFRRHAEQQTAVNNRARVTDREMIALLGRYVQSGQLDDQLRPGGFEHRLIIFRQIHYLRKSKSTAPDTGPVLRELRRLLPFPWFGVCWTWHRFTRPLVNLARKVDRLGAPSAYREPVGGGSFLATLPASLHRDEPRALRPAETAVVSSAPTWLEETSEAFQHPLPRGLAALMLLAGLIAAVFMVAERPYAPATWHPLARLAWLAPEPPPPPLHHPPPPDAPRPEGDNW